MSVFVKYRLAPSSTHGIGCFAAQEIANGDVIAKASPLDLNLSQEEFELLPESEKNEMTHYGHFDKVSGLWHLDFDLTRFANHSDSPNVKQLYDEDGYYIVAIAELHDGDEMLIDYSDFEGDSSHRKF